MSSVHRVVLDVITPDDGGDSYVIIDDIPEGARDGVMLFAKRHKLIFVVDGREACLFEDILRYQERFLEPDFTA